MSTTLACDECEHSEYSEYTSMNMCKITLAPAWMTYKERECVLSINNQGKRSI